MVTGNALIAIFIGALLLLFFLILKVKLEPFVALVGVAILTALAVGFPIAEVSSIVAGGFGNTLVSVGILIGLGVIFGELLAASGAVEKIAQAILKLFGVKKSAAGIALTGTAVSIPVFFDAAFVILSGLIKSLANKTKIPAITFVTALAVGLIVSHSTIIPTPGPMIVAENTGSDVGLFIIYGLIIAIPATLVGGYLYGMFIGRRIKPTESVEMEIAATDSQTYKKEISTGLSFFMLGLPILLIIGNTVTGMVAPDSTIATIFKLIGDKNVALFISVIAAIILLKPYIAKDYTTLYNNAINSAGVILLITGAGGAFGAVINQSGIGDHLITVMQGWNIHIFLLAFIFTQILRASLGSATVALVTTSSILGPQVAELGVSPVLLGLAICSGAIGLSLPNDSGFWVVNKFGKLTIPQTMKAWTIGGFIAGITALVVVYVLFLLSPILPGI
ncbi:GntP family permease [Caldibacillus lycopersici]|uniref:GntP family permease n=1 Tax=Perspicuibacillus lycopersici TaxID=1325689 RepID=A0AAE3LM02_9BACI|nr:GntP family permease [Perspicuibacillus lycopersici]MCU9613015.1 GntP family permease [Perspicuibacillus lycopersici]